MRDDRIQQQPNQKRQEAAEAKKPYAQPQLTNLGNLQTQTQQVQGGSQAAF